LQKTRAECVAAPFESLVARHASPSSMMAAPLRDLQRHIRHLGLFRKRAAHLKNLAAAIASQGTDCLSEPDHAASLPGLGVYGANAVASFGFGRRVGIVDCNSRRVISRTFGVSPTNNARIRRLSDELAIAAPDPRACNFGLLDVGALHCKPKPLCVACPLAADCRYARATRASNRS